MVVLHVLRHAAQHMQMLQRENPKHAFQGCALPLATMLST